MVADLKANKGKSKPLPIEFYSRPAALVAPDLLGCALIKRRKNGTHLKGIIVETEAYSQEEAACHGNKVRTPRNETLFGMPGHLYIYITYGIYHCVNIVTDKSDWASGVLLRALVLPNENERIAAGPGLLAKRFKLDLNNDSLAISVENGLWISSRDLGKDIGSVMQTTRVGISHAKELPWRWYIKKSRSISKRAKGDRSPKPNEAWSPFSNESP